MFCNLTDNSLAMNCIKPYDWAKNMLIGVYANDGKLMRFNEPRTKEEGLKQIPDADFRIIQRKLTALLSGFDAVCCYVISHNLEHFLSRTLL